MNRYSGSLVVGIACLCTFAGYVGGRSASQPVPTSVGAPPLHFVSGSPLDMRPTLTPADRTLLSSVSAQPPTGFIVTQSGVGVFFQRAGMWNEGEPTYHGRPLTMYGDDGAALLTSFRNSSGLPVRECEYTADGSWTERRLLPGSTWTVTTYSPFGVPLGSFSEGAAALP